MHIFILHIYIYLTIEEQIIWFDVPVYEPHPVNGVDGQHSLCNIKLRLLFSEGVFLHQEGHHVTWGEGGGGRGEEGCKERMEMNQEHKQKLIKKTKRDTSRWIFAA